jgi:uncharacterized membrane protein (UPF0127 family)
MNSFFKTALACIAVACASLASFAQAQSAAEGTPQSLPTVTIHIGPAALKTQIASTPHEGEIGLMYCRSMPDNDGMLFVLPVGVAQFWMKNTLIPLSVAFLDKNGTVLEIHDMKALDLHTTRSDSDQVAYAIESNLHWFDLNGIKPGMKIDPTPAAILKEADAHAAAH